MSPHLRHIAALVLVWGALSGCKPKTSAEAMQTRQRHPLCQFETLGESSEGDAALFGSGQIGGRLAAAVPAATHTTRQTADGYLVRELTSSTVMSLTLLGLGALAAALILTLGQRRPTARWAERLVQSLAGEVDRLRALGKGSDAVSRAIVERFEEPLTVAMERAQRLLERAIPLSRRDGAPTAQAHLESLHAQLEGLLALVERAHLQVLVWQERQHLEERAALESQVDAVIARLQNALEEVPV